MVYGFWKTEEEEEDGWTERQRKKKLNEYVFELEIHTLFILTSKRIQSVTPTRRYEKINNYVNLIFTRNCHETIHLKFGGMLLRGNVKHCLPNRGGGRGGVGLNTTNFYFFICLRIVYEE